MPKDRKSAQRSHANNSTNQALSTLPTLSEVDCYDAKQIDALLQSVEEKVDSINTLVDFKTFATDNNANILALIQKNDLTVELQNRLNIMIGHLKNKVKQCIQIDFEKRLPKPKERVGGYIVDEKVAIQLKSWLKGLLQDPLLVSQPWDNDLAISEYIKKTLNDRTKTTREYRRTLSLYKAGQFFGLIPSDAPRVQLEGQKGVQDSRYASRYLCRIKNHPLGFEGSDNKLNSESSESGYQPGIENPEDFERMVLSAHGSQSDSASGLKAAEAPDDLSDQPEPSQQRRSLHSR